MLLNDFPLMILQFLNSNWLGAMVWYNDMLVVYIYIYSAASRAYGYMHRESKINTTTTRKYEQGTGTTIRLSVLDNC